MERIDRRSFLAAAATDPAARASQAGRFGSRARSTRARAASNRIENGSSESRLAPARATNGFSARKMVCAGWKAGAQAESLMPHTFWAPRGDCRRVGLGGGLRRQVGQG